MSPPNMEILRKAQLKVPLHHTPNTDKMKSQQPQNSPRGRLGVKLYERLVANEEGKWSFASRHPLHSWRERYKTNQRWFDTKILRYQKKHGISPDASVVPPRPSAGKTSAMSSQSRPSRSSPPPAAGNGSKKRAREVDADDLSPDPGPAKKTRRENVTVQGSRTDDFPASPRVEPKKGKLRAKLSPSPHYDDDGDRLATGPDDYNGALDCENDQGEESQSDGDESSSPFPPSSPIKKYRLKNPSKRGRVRDSTDPEESSQPLASSSHQRHSPEHSPTATHPTAQPASGSMRKLAIPPLILSQEPTPPHSTSLNSPVSPPPREPPIRQRPSHRVVNEEEEDPFVTPPIQSSPSSPPPRAHARDAPRLVEGPYRSTYTRAKGSHRPAPRGRRTSRVPKEVEANSNERPPKRGKQDSPVSSPERPTAKDTDRASVQHIDLRVLHSRKSVENWRASSNTSFGSSSRTIEKIRPQRAKARRSSTTPNLSESNKELVLALGLEEVYKRMAENHKFHVDIVREVAARQRSLEHADRVLRSMREAAEQEYARLLKREFGTALVTGAVESDEEEEEEEEEEEVAKNLRDEEHSRSTPSQSASPHSNHSPPDVSMTNGGGYTQEDADGMEVDGEDPTDEADSSLPGSQALPEVEWTDDDDELLLDGDLAEHEELERRKGLGSVKFRTAHMYGLLLDG
ncbi:hypothetical protein EI94DRAFT_1797270 [Lactarius quietus]|nr:hypothetical protein EI94DRAFT_1797270 [Lactarius quietus]